MEVTFMRYGGQLGCQHESSLYKKLMGVGRGSQACLGPAGFGRRRRLGVVWSYGSSGGDCQIPGGNLFVFPPLFSTVARGKQALIHPVTIEHPL